jgi:hypothetical protein
MSDDGEAMIVVIASPCERLVETGQRELRILRQASGTSRR